jgi:hypothetical protein
MKKIDKEREKKELRERERGALEMLMNPAT